MKNTGEKRVSGINPVGDWAPSDIQLEKAILGMIIALPSLFDEIRFLEPEDFYQDKNRAFFEAMKILDAESQSVEALLVVNRLEQMGKQNLFEGNDPEMYIAELLTNPDGAFDVGSHAKELHNIAICRYIYFSLQPINDAAFHKRGDEAQLLIEQLASQTRTKANDRDLTIVHDLLGSYMERLDMLHSHRGKVVGVSSGLTDLDRLTGGFQNSDLIIFAARPAVGKTSLTLSMAHDMALKFEKHVAIFSLEMSKEQLVQRLLSMDAAIDQTKLRTGWIEDDEWERIAYSMSRLDGASIWIDDTPGISVSEIRSKARRLQASEGLDIIMVDYLQLMHAPGAGGKTENRVLEISAITRDLKELARELNVPVIALSQLSRAVENRQSKVPQLSDLRESGSIEQDADVVLFIYRDDVYNPDTERPNIADLIVAKHRNGPVGEVSAWFKKNQTKFIDLVAPGDQDAALVEGSLVAIEEEEEFVY